MAAGEGSEKYLEFVYLQLFERTAKSLLTPGDLLVVENALLEQPNRGVLQAGTYGVRKLRIGTEGHGKRGSIRIIYLHVPARQRIYLILAFAKNVQTNLTPEQKSLIRKLVLELKRE